MAGRFVAAGDLERHAEQQRQERRGALAEAKARYEAEQRREEAERQRRLLSGQVSGLFLVLGLGKGALSAEMVTRYPGRAGHLGGTWTGSTHG